MRSLPGYDNRLGQNAVLTVVHWVNWRRDPGYRPTGQPPEMLITVPVVISTISPRSAPVTSR